jgi:hypothetical protein
MAMQAIGYFCWTFVHFYSCGLMFDAFLGFVLEMKFHKSTAQNKLSNSGACIA